MNQRIKELAKQAEIKFESHLQHLGVDTAVIIPTDLEKFAELIVRECVNSIENTIKTDCITDSEKMGCEFAITDLMKHFGVEE